MCSAGGRVKCAAHVYSGSGQGVCCKCNCCESMNNASSFHHIATWHSVLHLPGPGNTPRVVRTTGKKKQSFGSATHGRRRHADRSRGTY